MLGYLETYICTFTEFVAGDYESGISHENTATVVATDDDGNSDTASDDATVDFTDVTASIDVEKFVSVDGGTTWVDADSPTVVYNSVNNEYLVVWYGEDGLVASEFEIYGQRLSGATGNPTGANDFVISDMGPVGDSAWSAFSPAVAYNPAANEYLVVWQGEDNRGVLVEGEYEIYGQRISGANGAAVGTDDFRISRYGTGRERRL